MVINKGTLVLSDSRTGTEKCYLLGDTYEAVSQNIGPYVLVFEKVADAFKCMDFGRVWKIL